MQYHYRVASENLKKERETVTGHYTDVLILVIDAGRVVERGSHAELMYRRGRYHALYVGQFTRQREQSWLEGEAALP